jgi:hypothetical protein
MSEQMSQERRALIEAHLAAGAYSELTAAEIRRELAELDRVAR